MSAREQLVLATKVYYPMSDNPSDRGLSRQHITTSIDRSLARMGTDHVDLYVIHAFDADTPVEETMEALHDTVRAGKVRYLGASTMYAWQFAKMNHVAAMNGWTPFVNMQCQYNLLYREEEREMLPYCRDQGIALTTFSPLARGFLARDSAAAGTARTAHDLYVAVQALGLRLDAAERAFLEAPYRPRDEINDQNPVRRPRALHPD
jgi:aryl-alcohol dehydrogenase-like predicted oxidoreductase